MEYHIDKNSYYLNETLPLTYLTIKKSIHGNTKNALSHRGLKLYLFIDNINKTGGLKAFFHRFPGIYQTYTTIQTVDLKDKDYYYARLWGQIGKAYEIQIRHEQTKSI